MPASIAEMAVRRLNMLALCPKTWVQCHNYVVALPLPQGDGLRGANGFATTGGTVRFSDCFH
jgi:hypothetical protein